MADRIFDVLGFIVLVLFGCMLVAVAAAFNAPFLGCLLMVLLLVGAYTAPKYVCIVAEAFLKGAIACVMLARILIVVFILLGFILALFSALSSHPSGALSWIL